MSNHLISIARFAAMQSRGRWLLLPAALATAMILFAVDPAGTRWFPVCPFHLLTGLDCPGCGSGRGLHALLHGRILAAADYNLLLIPALILLASGFYYKLTGNGQRMWQRLNKPAAILIITCSFWLLRNIPVYPLSWLNSGH